MSSHEPAKQENLLLNLVCNLALPTLILMKFSSDKWLGPLWGLVIALAFPVGYGAWDFVKRRKANFISIIGFVSVLLSGGFGLMHVNGFWFAVKDAAMPTLIGIAVLLSLRTKQPLVRSILFSDQVIDVPRVDAALDVRQTHADFERLLVRASYALAATFFCSAALNFFVARWLIRSAPGTEAFNIELGKMHSTGLAITTIPAMAMMMFTLWRLIVGIQALTGLETDAIFQGGEPPKKVESVPAPATEPEVTTKATDQPEG
jgi:intracellular septation protein A